MSKITAQLGINTSSFDAGLDRAAKSVGPKIAAGSMASSAQAGSSIGDAIGSGLDKALKKKAGVGKALKSFVGAIGIDITKLSDKLSESFFGASLDSLRALVQTQDEVGKLIEQNRMSMMDYAKLAEMARREFEQARIEAAKPRDMGKVTSVKGEFGRVYEITTGGETEFEAAERQALATKKMKEAEARLRSAEAARRAFDLKSAELAKGFARAGTDERTSDRIARLRDESDAMIALSRDVKDGTKTYEERMKFWEMGIQLATQAKQAQADLAKAERDNADAIREVTRESQRAGMTEAKRIAEMRVEAEQLLAKAASPKTTEADTRDLRLRAARLMADAKKEQNALDEKAIALATRLAELQSERASFTETEIQSITRLRGESDRLMRASQDATRKQADRDADRLSAQEKLNQAIEREVELRKSSITIGEIAQLGGTTRRGLIARSIEADTEKAKRFEARGRFEESERIRTRAEGRKETLLAERRLFLEDQDSKREQALRIVRENTLSPSRRSILATRAGIPTGDLSRLADEQRKKLSDVSAAAKSQDRVVSELQQIKQRLDPSSTQ